MKDIVIIIIILHHVCCYDEKYFFLYFFYMFFIYFFFVLFFCCCVLQPGHCDESGCRLRFGSWEMDAAAGAILFFFFLSELLARSIKIAKKYYNNVCTPLEMCNFTQRTLSSTLYVLSSLCCFAEGFYLFCVLVVFFLSLFFYFVQFIRINVVASHLLFYMCSTSFGV